MRARRHAKTVRPSLGVVGWTVGMVLDSAGAWREGLMAQRDQITPVTSGFSSLVQVCEPQTTTTATTRLFL